MRWLLRSGLPVPAGAWPLGDKWTVMVVKSILRCPLLRHHFLAVAAFIDQPGRRRRLVEVLPSSKPAAIIATPASAIVGPAFRELATAPAAIGPSPCPVMIPVLLRPNARPFAWWGTASRKAC